MNTKWIVTAYAVAALGLGATAARAQSIQGTVRSGGEPVIGATVRLLELDRADRTGAQGQFSFSDVPAGTYRVFVGVTGYLAVTDTVRVAGSAVSVAVDLTPSAIPLEEIVISGSPTARPAD